MARLEALAEDLGERALVVLREAVDGVADLDEPAAAALRRRATEEERRLARARRAVERAAGILRSGGDGPDGGDGG